ncbi:hypothetical protein [Streptomyces violaceusniger]|uniref:Uncharacterized protein n=1 Tax=Streptomyces violaceusniger (strain Tu 4113) TaxID=653045 RepID=G2PHN5_STRV4|nr:hypothetical protein [Streptomyces violaceusniger]AEM88836.1 hypothetical protein Strvi_0060 [Streptomyces violaceusniger Tu 4113]
MTALHDHGPYDCVPIADLDRIAQVASDLKIPLPVAACWLAMCKELRRQEARGVLPIPYGAAVEVGVATAYRRGEQWAAEFFRSMYAPVLGDLWDDSLLDVLATAAEVNGDGVTAAQAALGLLDA